MIPPIPSHVDMFGFTFRIDQSKDAIDRLHDNLHIGENRTVRHIIVIDPGIPLDRQWSVLLHEVIHFGIRNTGALRFLGLNDVQEESLVEGMEFFLFYFLRSNRLRFDWEGALPQRDSSD